ncbi:uncharacterized protein [Venturia canescens]|uniref:uncharacterized protein n=1 Tax=Venturia canescens TaxID=32260 RepID=UPI001C9C0621|nr:uncharacterized protein LOC122413676 [Venturia canescens]
MFKRLAKSRRHSADEVGCSLPPGGIGLEEAPRHELLPRKSLEGQIQALNTALLRVSRNKYARRSCGDAPTMQSLLAAVEEPTPTSRTRSETDYQTVTAVPAFIVEHEPEKQLPPQRGLGVWGRRMSKKIESFRRAGSRESICSSTDRSEHAIRENNNVYASHNNNNNNNDNTNNNNNNDRLTRDSSREKSQKSGNDSTSTEKTVATKKSEGKSERRFLSGNSHRSPSPFKSFFIRMGSTGMLNSNRGNNRRSEQLENTRITPSEKENLFRSCSTSHLNASPTYVKGDDPSDGIDLQIGNRRDKTLSCDDLAARRPDEDVFGNDTIVEDPTLQPSSTSFQSCDFGNSRNEILRKSSSCDLKETKKCNFPYAFLRSKLSVLPEERQHQLHSTKDERLFKATSEEHFPALKIEESFDGTTTLGRRGASRNNYKIESRLSQPRDNENWRYHRNSYAEPGETVLRGSRNSARIDEDRYSLNPSRLERIEDCFRQDDAFYESGYPRTCRSAMAGSLDRSSDSGFDRRPNQRQQSYRERQFEESNDLCGRLSDRRFSETSSLLNADLDVAATLRHQRRNSAPNAEQRLSSHYVSSNESGYDSDGPRGESTLASEHENISLQCVNTDSSDTSSVVDSEIEKPIRTSTPACDSSLHPVESSSLSKDFVPSKKPGYALEESGRDVNGLRWHRSNSGRILPSIHHQDSYPREDSSERLSSGYSLEDSNVAPHRARLQQDKTRFLSDIIQPVKRIRRCRLVQLEKKDSRESLGIRLAQQRTGELRYIVVQLENGGIAHRDGRLRLGDEIVQVEGKDLKTMEGLAEVQEFLKSFTGNRVRLVTAYDEALPQVFSDVAPPEEEESHEVGRKVKNSGALPPKSPETVERYESPIDKNSAPSQSNEIVQLRKRPDNLAVTSCLRNKNRKESLNAVENPVESQQYLTRHVAKFEKGYGKPSLGFSVVGGRDSPRGEMGIFVRRVFPGGQADVTKSLFQGDEILSLNGKVLRGYTHQEVIELFKAVREGPVELDLARRHRYPKTPVKSAPY